MESDLIVAGQNELHRRMSNEEFVWITRRNKERLEKLAATKAVTILAPPSQMFYNPEAQAREELARVSRQKLVDASRHPSNEQTKELLSYLDEKFHWNWE